MPGTAVNTGAGTTITFGTSGFTGHIEQADLSTLVRALFPSTYFLSNLPAADQIGGKTSIAGKLAEPGELTLEVQHNPQIRPPMHGPWETITITWPLVEGDGTAATWSCQGAVRGVRYSVPHDGKMMSSVIVAFSGLIEMTGATHPIMADLVLFWKLGEASGTRLDSIGDHPLTPTGGTGSRTGIVGHAASFNGTSQSLSIPDEADLNLQGYFTLSLWILVDTLVNGATPMNKGELIFTTSDFEYALEFFTPHVLVPIDLLFLTNETVDADFKVHIDADATWHHVVVWADDINNVGIVDPGNIYMHMQLDNATIVHGVWGAPLQPPATATAFPFQLGSSGSAAFFDGAIDAVGLWQRALTADERAYLWNNGDGREPPFA